MATKTNEIWVQEGDTRRQLEGAELSDYLATCKEINAKQVADKLALEEAAAAKLALLNKLGITEEEAKLLLS